MNGYVRRTRPIGCFVYRHGFSSDLILSCALIAAAGLTMQFVNIPLITVLQQTTEKRMIGRMMSFLMTVTTGLIPVSYIITSFLLGFGVGIQPIIIFSGAIVTLIAVIHLRHKKIRRLTTSRQTSVS